MIIENWAIEADVVSVPMVIVHNTEHMAAAMKGVSESGVRARIISPPSLAGTLGPGAFKHMVDDVAADFPDLDPPVLDCGGDAGTALAAIRAGCPVIAVDLTEETKAKIVEIASQSDVSVVGPIGTSRIIDLAASEDPAGTVSSFFSTGGRE